MAKYRLWKSFIEIVLKKYRVPDNKEFAALRSWLFTQRLRFRRGQLAQHFIDLLEELDPAWKESNRGNPTKTK
ncbi:helicase associated domain-containing protein [Microscilla marina]|uniref:helicase associated domain-containing protein n=1 Tax=Microscilla marina TaxID=1027 RepID=UPI0018DEC0DC|nr:helicase associated domain-containing protein [Microscilla marina]